MTGGKLGRICSLECDEIMMTTNQTKHTPGPWSHTPMQDTIWANDGEIKVATVADLPWVENELTGRRHSQADTEESNAQLIAAAPELLEACRDALHQLTVMREACYGLGDEYIAGAVQNLRQAITKAQGK